MRTLKKIQQQPATTELKNKEQSNVN